MKLLTILYIPLLGGILLLVAGPAAYSSDLIARHDSDLDRIVAVVDEDVITHSELDRELARVIAQLKERNTTLPAPELLQRQVLERMISKRLQLQAAEHLGLQIDDATLDRAINNIATQHNLSLSQLHDRVEGEGINFTKFRDDTRQQLLMLRLQNQEVINHITITDQEVELFLHQNKEQASGREEVHLQHILVATPDGATPDVIQHARDKAETLLKKLRTGADFAQTAVVYSDGHQALEGGDLGWMPISQVPTIATDAARTLKPGEISDPIRSSSGFHLFRLVEVKDSGEHQVIAQTHARHILIKTNELVSDQEAQTRLAQIRIRLLGGEQFDTLARSNSDDTASAIKGGDLGWLSHGDTVPEFEEQMNALTVGESSQPFRTQFGWHIVQVLERQQHDNTEDTLKNKARENLRNRKVEEATDLWLRRLRDEAYVEIRLD